MNAPAASLLALLAHLCAVPAGAAQTPEPARWNAEIPKVWDDDAMAALELPLADPASSPRAVSSEAYYRLPARPIFKSYPVYHPDREPDGYWEWLARQEPQIAFDPSGLRTEQDWIDAGARVFDAPVAYSTGRELAAARDRASYEQIPLTRDGVSPFGRYVVREKGKVELGLRACSSCHTRVLDDGTALRGGQGNAPFGRMQARLLRARAAEAAEPARLLADVRAAARRAFSAPWLEPDPNAATDSMSVDEIARAWEAVVPGVVPLARTSLFHPPRVPDLFGLEERSYLGATGFVQHRAIGDLMRYIASKQGAGLLASFGGFVPDAERQDPASRSRYSDEALYALALYVYSLEPPESPYPRDESAMRGQELFDSEGCADCHVPPEYSNGKLQPAPGFRPPRDHYRRFAVRRARIRTDPSLTRRTRVGTGYYKVPSLRGVWSRGPFGHEGGAATLEDWFDPARVEDDWVPTGFRGAGVERRAVRGHLHGLNLTPEQRRDLIAFLRTL